MLEHIPKLILGLGKIRVEAFAGFSGASCGILGYALSFRSRDETAIFGLQSRL
jgi:hypothetical protein